jgi:hypothetical protein
MRKFLMAVAVVMLAIAVTVPAMALDFKFSSANRFRMYSVDGVGNEGTVGTLANSPFLETRTNQTNQADLRFRPWFRVSDDNGNVQSELRLEIGDVVFGDSQTANPGRSSGGTVGSDGVNVETKWAYIDVAMPFGVPARLRGGLQGYFLPKGAIIDDDGAGLRLYGTVKPFSYDFWWLARNERTNPKNAQPSGAQLTDANGFATGAACVIGSAPNCVGPANDDWDAYAAKFDVALMPAFNPYVYGVYSRRTVTSATGNSDPSQAFWIGAGTVGTIGIVKYDLDFIYGDDDANLAREQKGWFVDGGVEVPVGPVAVGLRGMYATGDEGAATEPDKNADFPGISPSFTMNGMSQIFWDSGGSTYFQGQYQASPANTWAIGGYVQYVPVKALTLRGTYIYIGVPESSTNGYTGKSSIGHELEFLASYQLWTGTKANGFVGFIFPAEGRTAAGAEVSTKTAQVYAFTVTHDF